MTLNRYALCHQLADEAKKQKREHAHLYADKWRDPFTFLDDDDMKYSPAGGIKGNDTMDKAKDIFSSISNRITEIQAILALFQHALWSNETTIFMNQSLCHTVSRPPLIEISKYPRVCCICGLKTSSGMRALCDDHHQQFILDKNYRHTPLTYDEVARLIWVSDIRHRERVRQKLADHVA